MLKYYQIAVIYLLGIALSFVGGYFKIESWPYASECLLASMALQVFAVATLILKIIKQKGFKEQ